MGMTLYNLHLYNPEQKEYKLRDGYRKLRVIDGWDSILESDGKHDFNRLARLARELSRAVNTAVISVCYFDDDELEIAATVDGKRKAFFSVGYLGRNSKKIPELTAALRLDEKDTKIFCRLTRDVTDAEKAIGEFSAVCSLPFFLDPETESFDQIQAELTEMKNKLLDRIGTENKQRSANRKKSQKAELLEEIPGDVVRYYFSPSPADSYKGVFRMVELDTDGIDYGKVHCYQVTDGTVPGLKKVFDYRIPIHEITGAPKDLNIWIHTNPLWSVDEYGHVFRDKEELVFLTPPCYCHYSTTDKTEIARIGDLGVIPEDRLSDNSYRFGDEDAKIAVKLQAELDPEHDNDSKDYISTYKIKMTEDTIVKIGCYEYTNVRFDLGNKDGELTETVIIPENRKLYHFSPIDKDFAYLKDERKIIYGNILFDLDKKTSSKIDVLPEKNVFMEYRKGLLIIATARNIQVFDRGFDLRASYPVKGRCFKWFYDKDDALYVLTSTIIHGENERGMKAGDMVRLYKIPL